MISIGIGTADPLGAHRTHIMYRGEGPTYAQGCVEGYLWESDCPGCGLLAWRLWRSSNHKFLSGKPRSDG
jgi:hypothetical protein